MNEFVTAVEETQNTALTFNSAKTNLSSQNRCVDLFFLIGNRDKDFSKEFELAFQENIDLAVRISLWVRDIRGGAGERQTFRNLLVYMEDKHPDELSKIIPKIPEVGRWDDLLVFKTDKFKNLAAMQIQTALNDKNGLCAKWMPRKGNTAVDLRNRLEMTPKQYRKTLVTLSQTVEAKMCAKEFDTIEYDHVPSVASARYQKAFYRNDEKRYTEYKEGLKAGTRKINAGAVYPYDIVKSVREGDHTVSQAQWDALPNFMGESSRVLPMIDTSGSMYSWSYYGQNSGNENKMNVTPLDIAISLGIYVADKQVGAFKDIVLSFSENPKIQKLTGNLITKISSLTGMHWGMNTNITKAMMRILDLGKKHNIPNEDMPKTLLILSDMEFDSCGSDTIFEHTKKAFENAGYTQPKIVFWNMNSRSGNNPVTFKEDGTSLVSGFSPSILKSVLSDKLENYTPENVMLETIMVDKYKWM